MSKIIIPPYGSFMNPVLQALKQLGGSGTITEINAKAVDSMGLSDAQLEVIHDPKKGTQTEVAYRLAWVRTYLKIYNVLENSSRGVWSLTPKGAQTEQVDPQVVKRFVQQQRQTGQTTPLNEDGVDEASSQDTWRDTLLECLVTMEYTAFERLVQRILRESGFVQVEVTGRSGDGGIDGKGIMRLAGLFSFHVIFQCKRYRGSVSVNQVRDFRGAMIGRADKGLLITTGNFTKEAMREATRDGAPAIDMIDGNQLLDKLKELGLGVETRRIQVEQVIVDKNWFASI